MGYIVNMGNDLAKGHKSKKWVKRLQKRAKKFVFYVIVTFVVYYTYTDGHTSRKKRLSVEMGNGGHDGEEIGWGLGENFV